MPHFNSIIQCKQNVRKALLNDQELVNLLLNAGDNTLEFDNYSTGSNSEAAKLIKKSFYIPDTTVEAKNFISMRGQITYTNTNVVKSISLIIYVICNEENIELKQGSRADLIANRIDNILNKGDSVFGLGKFSVGIAEEREFNTGFYGWSIPYFTHDFNRAPENY